MYVEKAKLLHSNIAESSVQQQKMTIINIRNMMKRQHNKIAFQAKNDKRTMQVKKSGR